MSRQAEAVRFVDGVRVRWRYNRTGDALYLCDDHGPLAEATCPHALATAVSLAREVLGVEATTNPTEMEIHP
jgi:hypothetical protein